MRCCRLVDVKIGVLALQGNVSEHIDAFRLALIRMGQGASSEVFEIRHPAELAECNALAIPGGESTTISRLIDKNHHVRADPLVFRWYFCYMRRHGADGDPC